MTIFVQTAQTFLGIVGILFVVGGVIGYIVGRGAGQSVRLGSLVAVLIGVVLFTVQMNTVMNDSLPHLRRDLSWVPERERDLRIASIDTSRSYEARSSASRNPSGQFGVSA